MKLIPILLSLSFWLSPASGHSIRGFCDLHFDFRQSMSLRFGQPVRVRQIHQSGFYEIEIREAHQNPNSSPKASLTYYLSHDDSRLNIESIFVQEAWRKRGIARELIRTVLERHSNIREIYASLTAISESEGTNYARFVETVAEGRSAEEAIRQTPAYKIRAALGFSEIIPGSVIHSATGPGAHVDFAVRGKYKSRL